jgi:hypothetical protein
MTNALQVFDALQGGFLSGLDLAADALRDAAVSRDVDKAIRAYNRLLSKFNAMSGGYGQLVDEFNWLLSRQTVLEEENLDLVGNCARLVEENQRLQERCDFLLRQLTRFAAEARRLGSTMPSHPPRRS